MKYEVTYKIVLEVHADDKNEAHQKADDELDELIRDEESCDHYYLKCEIAKNVREIKLIDDETKK